jgi:hypothetical protein
MRRQIRDVANIPAPTEIHHVNASFCGVSLRFDQT